MKYWQAFTFLLFAFSGKTCFKATNDTLRIRQMADSFFVAGSYYKAAIYYQKLEFFLQSESGKTQARLRTAESYKHDRNYTEGLASLNTINLSEAPDSLIYTVKYQSALMSYLNNDLIQADAFIEQLNYLVKDSLYIYKSLLLHTLVLNEQYKWQSAHKKLHLLNAHLFTTESYAYHQNKRMIDSLYNTARLPKLKDPEKASRLSTFLPGAGQFYTRNYSEGIFSFLSLAVTTGAMVTGIVFQYYFTSIFVGNLLIGKFYLGGVKRSEFLAEKYNYKKAKVFNDDIKKSIQIHFKSNGR